MSVITDCVLYDLVVVTTTILVGVIAFWKWKLSYWNNIGVPTLSPTIFFGDTKDLLLGRKSFGEQFEDLYRQSKQKGYKHVGVYMGSGPFYVPIDPEILKHILQKDFQHFVNRIVYVNEENDPLTGHLVALKDAKWRNMRTKLTPTFTSGKMKMMFQTLADCTIGLGEIMDESTKNRTAVDIKDILGRFTTDIIGSSAFGIECNSLKDSNSLFRKYGKKVFELSAWERITNPDVQDKLREEINAVLKKHDDQLTYDAIAEMTYMDKVLNETLRKYPPVPFLNRSCTKDYTIPNTSIVIKKGVKVGISVLGLHRDPEYYPNPDKFDPERFSEENKNSRPAFTWIPFGEGPRNCIGLRFGMLQSKVGLTALLKNYKLRLSNKTKLPLQMQKSSFITTAEGGIWLDVEKLS